MRERGPRQPQRRPCPDPPFHFCTVDARFSNGCRTSSGSTSATLATSAILHSMNRRVLRWVTQAGSGSSRKQDGREKRSQLLPIAELRSPRACHTRRELRNQLDSLSIEFSGAAYNDGSRAGGASSTSGDSIRSGDDRPEVRTRLPYSLFAGMRDLARHAMLWAQTGDGT